MTEMQMQAQDGALLFKGNLLEEKFYDPNNFTYAAYRAQLTEALEAGYQFISFDDAQTASTSKTIILRHDEPFSLQATLAMARLNNQLGVSSTFFVNPDNKFYDLSTNESQAILQEISTLGQYIGLQIQPRDKDLKPLNPSEIEAKAEDAKNSLETLISKSANAITFDRTGGIDVPDDQVVAGMINVYGDAFADGKNRTYNSNSNGMNLFASNLPSTIGAGAEHIHLLVHPCWISEQAMLPHARLMQLPEIQANPIELQRFLETAHNGGTGRVIVGDGYDGELDIAVKAVMERNRPAALKIDKPASGPADPSA